jgi:hypothetical protein
MAMLVPLALASSMVASLWVAAPHWDQWDYEGVTLAKFYNHSLSFADVFAQHNESRIALPRLLTLLYAPLTGWDIRYEVVLTILCAVLLAIGLNVLALRDYRLSLRQRLCCVVVADIAVLSCAQWEVFLFGAYYFIIPTLAVVWALLIKQTSWSQTKKTSAWIILSLAATFSYANGVLVWLFVAGAICAPEPGAHEKKRTLWALAGYCSVGLITILAYFRSYIRPSGHPSIVGSVLDPLRVLLHYLAWIGAPLGAGVVERSLAIGAVQLLSFLMVAGYIIAKIRSGALSSSSFGWLLIATFILTTGLAVSVGRSGFGIEQALSSRYETFSTALLPVMCPLVLLCGNLVLPRLRDEDKVYCTVVLSFIGGGCFVLFVLNSTHGWVDARNYGDVRRRAELALEFVNVIPDNPQLALSYPAPEKIVGLCNQLSPHHLPFVTEPGESIARLVKEPTPLGDRTNGFLDRVLETRDGKVIVTGWAILKDRKKPAGGVLLVWEGDDGRVRPVSVVPVNGRRPDVASALANGRSLWSGFDSPISKANFPGPGVIAAWAIDLDRYFAYQLGVTTPIRVSAR